MMIDWWAILLPLPIALIALFFLFLGCTSFGSSTPTQTTLQLNPDSHLQDVPSGVPPAQSGQVSKLNVTFTLTDTTNPSTPPLVRSGTIADSSGGPINPGDATALFSVVLDDATVGTRNQVMCACQVVLTSPSLMLTASPQTVGLKKDGMNKFLLEPVPPANPAKPTRKFQVIFDAAGA
jgi:hypothetical protein